MLTLPYTAAQLSFQLIYRWDTVVWPQVTHSSLRRGPKLLMTLCAVVCLQWNAAEGWSDIWGGGEHGADEKGKKAEICNKRRAGRCEKATMFGRNTTGKYCGRDTDVTCRKKEIRALTERTIIYKKLILPTNWHEALCTASLRPNKVTLDRTLSFTLSFFRSLSPHALLTITTLRGENDLKHTHSDLKS